MRYIVVAVLILAAAITLVSQPAARIQVGPQQDGAYLLNSGWRVKPAGTQVPLDTFPMATAMSPDAKHLLVLHGGYNPPSVVAFDPATMREKGRVTLADGWLGLAFAPDGKKVYAGGGSKGRVYELDFNNGAMTIAREFLTVEDDKRTNQDFIGDVAISPDGRLIYAADLFHDTVLVINPQSGRVTERFATGRRPYRILFHPDGKSFFVSSWADGAVYQHQADTGARMGVIRLGSHTTDMLWRDKGEEKAGEGGEWTGRLFVAAANTNSVFVVAVDSGKNMRLLETINVALTARHRLGMTPSGLALSPDRNSLYVVCSDANAVAVADVREAQSRVTGFLPVGWYPTAARSLPDGRLMVLNGKGDRSYPNPRGPNPALRAAPTHQGIVAVQYVGRLQTGSASVIPPFNPEQLEAYTKSVYDYSPYRDRNADDRWIVCDTSWYTTQERKSPIEHVIYIVKENRTYDQVFGDLGKGNGDPSLVLFDAKSTPNHRKLANDFVLFDNFYVSADVSADGHNWSTAAIAPDYVQRMWPNSYGGRRRNYDYEGGEPAALPPAGYLWTNVLAAGISMRNYGYFVQNVNPAAPTGQKQIVKYMDNSLAPVTNENYRNFDMDYPDVDRAKVFLADLAEFEKRGSMPQFMIMRLGNDHTSGTSPGKWTPQACMADNDYALGMIVEAVSKSRFWGKTAIFVLEDDAQNGPDHVDSHRSPAFVISPYTRRGVIDSTLYNTASMLRTMGLILGLRPMTHFDASATPMTSAFSKNPNNAPWQAEQPRISLNERNPATSATAGRSLRMNFTEADRIDDDELNDILWRAIRGTEPPAPVRSYFGGPRAR